MVWILFSPKCIICGKPKMEHRSINGHVFKKSVSPSYQMEKVLCNDLSSAAYLERYLAEIKWLLVHVPQNWEGERCYFWTPLHTRALFTLLRAACFTRESPSLFHLCRAS